MKRKQQQRTIFVLAVALLAGHMFFLQTEQLFFGVISTTIVFVAIGILMAIVCLAKTTQQ